ERGNAVQARHDVLVVRNARRAHRVHELGHVLLPAVPLVDREILVPEAVPLDLALEAAAEQIVVEPVRCRQPLAPDRLHHRERLVELPLATLDRRERVVGPAVRLAGVADVGGELGKLPHPVLPVHPEQLVQAGAVAQAPRVRDQLGVALVERARGCGPLGDYPCEGAKRTREGYDADTDHGSSYGRSGAGGRTSAARGTIAATLADRRALLSDGRSGPGPS